MNDSDDLQSATGRGRFFGILRIICVPERAAQHFLGAKMTEWHNSLGFLAQNELVHGVDRNHHT